MAALSYLYATQVVFFSFFQEKFHSSCMDHLAIHTCTDAFCYSYCERWCVAAACDAFGLWPFSWVRIDIRTPSENPEL